MAEQDPPDENEDGPKKSEPGPSSVATGTPQNPPESGTIPAPDRHGATAPALRVAAHPPALPAAPRISRSSKHAALTLTIYEYLWKLYESGVRDAKNLAKLGGVGWETAKKAIEKGWPERQWPPLMERAKLLDREREKAEADIAVEKFREQVDEFYKVRRRNLQAAETATSALFGMVRKCFSNLEASTFIRYRRVREVVFDKAGKPLNDGQPVEHDKPYVPAKEVAQALRSTATAIREIGMFERTWLQSGRGLLGAGAPETGDETMPPARPMTPEQIAYMDSHDGQLPPGCTDEQFVATLTFLTGQQAKRDGTG